MHRKELSVMLTPSCQINRQRQRDYRLNKSKVLIYESRVSSSLLVLLTIFYCIVATINLTEAKSTQLETENHQLINNHHKQQDLPEKERPDREATTSTSVTDQQTGNTIHCVCNNGLCVMSMMPIKSNESLTLGGHHHQPETRTLDGGRPPRQTHTAPKYSVNSLEYRVADATNRFGLLFLNNLAPKDNVIYSPISLQAILNMLYMGSKQNSSTSDELSQALGYDEFNLSGDDPHQGLSNIFKDIADLLVQRKHEQPSAGSNTGEGNHGEAEDDIVDVNGEELPVSSQLNFTMNNLVLTNKDLVDVNKDYQARLRKYYKVRLAQFRRRQAQHETNATTTSSSPVMSADKTLSLMLNMTNELDPVLLDVENEKQLAEAINGWVSDQTHHKIERLVEEKDVPLNDLALALLNSAFFQAAWQEKFEEEDSLQQEFYNQGIQTDPIQRAFLRKTHEYGYAQFGPKPSQEELASTTKLQQGGIETPDLDCQALEIPFSIGRGKELSMLFLLPNQHTGIDKLQRSLTAATLRGIYNALEDMKVNVLIPKFTIEKSYEVKNILERMGIRSVFDPAQASLTEMVHSAGAKEENSRGVTFSVDKIVHNSKIEVHETGAEASSATFAGVLLRASLYVRPTPTFNANHPFLFIIRHIRSNVPLFMGRVNELQH